MSDNKENQGASNSQENQGASKPQEGADAPAAAAPPVQAREIQAPSAEQIAADRTKKVAAIDKKISDVSADIKELDASILRFQTSRARAQAAVDQLVLERQRVAPPPSANEAYNDYLKRQGEEREARGRAQQRLLQIQQGLEPISAGASG